MASENVSIIDKSNIKKSVLNISDNDGNTTSHMTQNGHGTANNSNFDYGDDDNVVESNFMSNIYYLFGDFFPDNTPTNFLLLHTLAFFVFLCFSPLSFPVFDGEINENNPLPEILEHFVFVPGHSNPDESQYSLVINALLYLLWILLLNCITLIVVLLSRIILIRCISEPLCRISRYVVVFTYSVDPSLFYCIWSVLNYTLFIRYVQASTIDTFVAYKLYVFGDQISELFWIDSRCYSLFKSLYFLHILFSVRKLILSTLLFLFELQFLTNYTTDLRAYLTDLLCLRRFNSAWYQYVDAVRRDLTNSNSRKMNELVVKYKTLDLPSSVAKSYNSKLFLQTKDDFKIFKPMIAKWQRHTIIHNGNLKSYDISYFIREKWIKMSSTKATINWILLNYVIHNPPELLLLNCTIQLLKRDTVDICSNLLFDQIYDTLSDDVTNLTERLDSKEEIIGASDGEEGNDSHRAVLNMQSKISGPLPELLRYRSTILNPDISVKKCVNILKKDADVQAEDEETTRFLTPKMCGNLNPSVVESFFSSYDLTNCRSISANDFVRNLTYVCSIRKKLIDRLKNQRSILKLVGNLLSITLWFVTLIAFTLSLRINRNIVLPSTIGLFSATIVALSYMYTSFITAIIFVVISNPYNMGDRVRIAGGEPLYVRRITTYTTEFTCIHGKHVICQNGLLSKLTIINETRANNATHEIKLEVSPTITPAALKLLKENIRMYINGRPRDFVTNGCYFYGKEVQINHYYQIIIWVTCVESWVNPIVVFKLRSDILRLIAKQCRLLGITYKLPPQPLSFNNSIIFDNNCSADHLIPS